MKRRRRLLFLPTFFALWFVAAAPARAAEEKGSNPAEQGIGEVFKWINFAIVAGAIGYLCVKKGPGFFRGRAERIGAAITQAAAAKAEADRQLRDAETRLGTMEQEIAGLRVAAEREAAAEGGRIRAATQFEVEKIARAVEGEIEAAERGARFELKALAARLAVDGAASLLTKQLTPQVQEALLSAFVQDLAGRPN
jgi:F0F1-type ATP synthase membrane subunit b/b'